MRIPGGPWPWFRAVLRLPDGTESLGVFLRCPDCGSVVDWRDQRIHLISHGITNIVTVTEIERQQQAEWNP